MTLPAFDRRSIPVFDELENEASASDDWRGGRVSRTEGEAPALLVALATLTQ